MIVFGFACSSIQSLQDQYPDAIELTPSPQVPYDEKDITIRSVEPVQSGRQYALLIEGDFPNPCTQLLRVNEKSGLDKLNLKILGWQKHKEMCAEVITPFTFIYEIPKEDYEKIDSVSANGKTFELDKSNS